MKEKRATAAVVVSGLSLAATIGTTMALPEPADQTAPATPVATAKEQGRVKRSPSGLIVIRRSAAAAPVTTITQVQSQTSSVAAPVAPPAPAPAPEPAPVTASS